VTETHEPTAIVTHNDFDGLGSAALLSWAFDIEDIRFTGPIAVANAEIPITRHDAVCDLPYPLECGLWFDHHAGNLDELKLRGIDPQTIPGRFAVAPSCVRVVFDYFTEQGAVPEDFAVLAGAADVIDSFSFPNLEAWRADTAANRVDRALKAASATPRAHHAFLRDVTFLLRDFPLTEAAEDPQIVERAAQYEREEAVMLEHITKYGFALSEDENQELIFVDCSGFSNPTRIDKKLIGMLHPQARGYVEIKPVFRSGRKMLDLSVSLSLALADQKAARRHDVGDIVRELNIGDGHAGAAAGVWRCASALEFQRAREELPRRILALWRKQA
jgi:hypothetical protein